MEALADFVAKVHCSLGRLPAIKKTFTVSATSERHLVIGGVRVMSLQTPLRQKSFRLSRVILHPVDHLP
jgi:hypothetical protein